MRQYHKQWYKDVMVVRRQEWFKENGPCVDCGSWERLEVDHIDPSTKVNHAVWSWTEKRRIEELSKCAVRCYDCHKKKSVRECFEMDVWKATRKVIVDGTAWCNKCEKSVPVGNFHKDKYACNGLYAICKDCRRKLPSRGWKGNWTKKDKLVGL